MKNKLKNPKFCVSIAIHNSTKLNNVITNAFASGAHLAEIRLDSLNSFSFNQINKLSNVYKNRLIFTFRSKNQGGLSKISESDRIQKLIQLLDLKHSIKDIEYDTFLSHSSIFNDEKNLIVSWHNFKSTPSTNSMENQIKKISTKLKHPEQIIKVVTYANSLNDCNKVFDLYPRFEKSKFQLLAFCMSETGSITRVLSPILGAPFIYCFTGTKSVAPGQINLNILKEIYSNFS